LKNFEAIKVVNLSNINIKNFNGWVIAGPYSCARLWGVPKGGLSGNLYALYHKKSDDEFCGKNDLVRSNGISVKCWGCKTKPPENLVNLVIFLRKTEKLNNI